MQVAEGARHRKASKIIGIDINPDKFALGQFFFLILLIFVLVGDILLHYFPK